MNCAATQNRIHPYMDGELDLIKAIAIEAHLNRCPACKESYQKHNVSRAIVRNHATYYAAPRNLRGCIHTSIQPAPGGSKCLRRWVPSWRWTPVAAALTCSMVFAWAVTYLLAVPTKTDRLSEEIVSSHVRSLITGHLADVTASGNAAAKSCY